MSARVIDLKPHRKKREAERRKKRLTLVLPSLSLHENSEKILSYNGPLPKKNPASVKWENGVIVVEPRSIWKHRYSIVVYRVLGIEEHTVVVELYARPGMHQARIPMGKFLEEHLPWDLVPDDDPLSPPPPPHAA